MSSSNSCRLACSNLSPIVVAAEEEEVTSSSAATITMENQANLREMIGLLGLRHRGRAGSKFI